jgi:hypothetical protein
MPVSPPAKMPAVGAKSGASIPWGSRSRDSRRHCNQGAQDDRAESNGDRRFTLPSLPARGLLGLIWLYRHSISPVLPVVCGPGCGCRFHPTCAVYAADAVRTHGAVRGSWLAVRRLLRCHPWHPGGFDPVPRTDLPLPSDALQPMGPSRPVCRRTPTQAKASHISLATRKVEPLGV